MDRELAVALKDLGLTATEASIYVALLEHCGDGPVSAYKLAQDMGRDPANMTKTLAAMVKRGAVHAGGKRPKLYAPVRPADFTGELVARIQARQRQAVALLDRIGQPAADESLRPLESRRAGLDRARSILESAGRIVLVDASADLLAEIAADLSSAASERGVTVLARSTDQVAAPGVRIWIDPDDGALSGAAPGPWLRLTVDGHSCLEMTAHPEDPDLLLHGSWSRSPGQAFLAHRSLGSELILTDLLEMLRSGAGTDLVRRHAEDQATLILRQIAWRRQWREIGLPDYAPETADVDPDLVARTMAELDDEVAVFQPDPSPVAKTPVAEEVTATDEDDGGGPLQFIFRRRKRP